MEEILHVMQRSQTERIQFSTSQFKGKTYVNIRTYYLKDGDYYPSKKGVSVPIDNWDDFMTGIHKLDDELRLEEIKEAS